ncbi:MAG TPA: PhnD/SsuA/transferrin family substrate-binding protein [Methylocella sp.]
MLLGGSFLVAQTAFGKEPEFQPSIRFGLTPVFLTSDLELLGRLQEYLQRAMGLPVALAMRRSYQEITALLTSDQLDAAWMCGYPFVTHRAELRPVAVPLWRAKPLYQSDIIIDHDRQAQEFAELRGDIHAFSRPDSNSGFLVTRALLAEHGLCPQRITRKSHHGTLSSPPETDIAGRALPSYM